MTFTWENLYVSARNRNKNIKTKFIEIIKSTSGYVEPGEVLAIMGPSGGGKSTLLNLFSGRVQTGAITQGCIKYNGKERELNRWVNDVGFVEQDAKLMEELTIEQNLTYSYKFNSDKRRSGKRGTSKKKLTCKQVVDGIINDLNLEKVSSTITKKLSGGERKRVSIGAALVKNPSILLLDEPTSGLDMDNAIQICKMLKDLAIERNMIIIMTIHQPNQYIYSLFDKLLLLSSGNVLYYGSAHKAEEYFIERGLVKSDLFSTPDFIIQISGSKYKNEHPELFYDEASPFKENIIIKDKKIMKTKNDFIYSTPNFYHIFLLLKREFHSLLNKKYQFAKTMIFKLLIIASSILIVYYVFLLMFLTYEAGILLLDSIYKKDPLLFMKLNGNPFLISEYILDNQQEYIQFLEEVKNNKDAIRNEMSFKLVNILSYIFILIFIFQIIYSVPVYFDKIRANQVEVQYWYYSGISLFTELIIFQIINELFLSVITYGFIYYMFPIENSYVLLFFILMPFVVQPFSFFISSITPMRTLAVMMSILFGFISSIPIYYIMLAVDNLGSLKGKIVNKLPYISYIFFLLSPIFFTNSFFYLIQKDKGVQGDRLNVYLKFIYRITLSPTFLHAYWTVLTVLLLFAGFFLNNLRIPMHVRMKIEKER